MITYLLCCLMLSCLSSTVFLLLLPNKYVLGAYCMENTGVGWGRERGMTGKPVKDKVQLRVQSADDNREKGFSCY